MATKATWDVTIVAGSGSVYQHFFPEGSEKSACGRTVRSNIVASLSALKEDDVKLCKICKRKQEAKARLAKPVTETVPVNADDKMSIVEATQLICSFLGDDFISPNAMYNRIWRVGHCGADPACAPRFGHVGKRAFFQRAAVMDWIRAQVRASAGVDFSHLPADLASLL